MNAPKNIGDTFLLRKVLEVMTMQLRAMVIDDSKVMRTMVMNFLQRTNLAEFQFSEAGNGKEALAQFNPEKFDILFVDWNMPEMSGIDFVRKVRGMKNTEHIPIIMVTSEKSMGKIEEALDDAGADAYISKPFTVEALSAKVSKLVKKIEEDRNKPKQASGGFFHKLMGK
jgi:two-component system chemotaxis response regulator CheY